MKKLFASFSPLLNATNAVLLAAMCLVVFGNVILRYGFNSGIVWSEEIARICFVWITFLGAIVALKDNDHLAVDMFVNKLPKKWKKIAYAIGNLLVLFAVILVMLGSWKLTMINRNDYTPAMGIPKAYVFGIGILMSVCMAVLLMNQLYRMFFTDKPHYEKDGTDVARDL